MKNLIFTHWKTTLVALIGFITMLLTTYGILSPTESGEVNTLFGKLIFHIKEVITIVMGIVLMFSKDYNKQ